MDEWNAKDVDYINERTFLTAKPARATPLPLRSLATGVQLTGGPLIRGQVVYLVNLSPEDYLRKKNKWLGKIAEWVNAHGGGRIIPFSGVFEAKLLDMPDDERTRYLTEEVKSESALTKIVKTGFAAIHLIYFFTAARAPLAPSRR